MSDEIDMSGVDPVRWAEVRRRIRVIEKFHSSDRTEEAAREAADDLGISINQFRRLERVWRVHRQASLIAKSGASRRQKRSRPSGIQPETLETIRQTIRDLGADARIRDIVAETHRRCDEHGFRRASDKAIWTKVMQERAEHPGATDPTPKILIGKCALALPVETAQGLVRPRAWLAVLMPEAVVAAIDVTFEPGDQPSLARVMAELRAASDEEAAPRPVVMSAFNLLAAGPEFDGLLTEKAGGRNAHVASRLGNLLGGIAITDYVGDRTADRYIRSHLDTALAAADAERAVRHALAAHNQRIRPEGLPAFRLA